MIESYYLEGSDRTVMKFGKVETDGKEGRKY